MTELPWRIIIHTSQQELRENQKFEALDSQIESRRCSTAIKTTT